MDGKWQVLRQEPMTAARDGGGFHSIVRVTFRTAAGVTSYVDVSREAYSVESVRAAIDAHAAELDAVAGL